MALAKTIKKSLWCAVNAFLGILLARFPRPALIGSLGACSMAWLVAPTKSIERVLAWIISALFNALLGGFKYTVWQLIGLLVTLSAVYGLFVFIQQCFQLLERSNYPYDVAAAENMV